MIPSYDLTSLSSKVAREYNGLIYWYELFTESDSIKLGYDSENRFSVQRLISCSFMFEIVETRMLWRHTFRLISTFCDSKNINYGELRDRTEKLFWLSWTSVYADSRNHYSFFLKSTKFYHFFLYNNKNLCTPFNDVMYLFLSVYWRKS